MIYWRWLIVIACIASCQSKPVATPVPTAVWVQFEQSFFKDLWSLYPVWASAQGLREYDKELRIPNKNYFEEQKAFVNKFNQRLEQIRLESLQQSEQVDYRLVKNFLDSTLWDLETFKSHEWDFSKFNVGSALATVYESKVAVAERVQNLRARLKKIPDYYAAAFLNITKPTQEHLRLAVQQNKGTVLYMQNTLTPFLKQMTDKEAHAELTTAETAIQRYIQKLENLDQRLKKKNDYKSFRIGTKLYNEKFDLDLQINATAENIYAYALQEQGNALREMIKLSHSLWDKYFPQQKKPKEEKQLVRTVVARLTEAHATQKTFLDEVRAQLPQLSKFVKEKNLLEIDSSKSLVVRNTPEYEQGFAVAGVDAPGPFDSNKETFYNVMPLDKMNGQRAASFLREYNNYTLQILNIHEAIPGHYVQLVYSRKTPSLIKAVFGNGTMSEGWAVYCERMMLENGYGNQEPELWLMYYKWYLRVVANTILDYEIHNKNLTREGAMRLLMEDSFQEKTEAEMKWDRATYSQVQLASYFSGFSEIYRFREQMQKEKDFNLKNFHETFLSFGSAPIRDIIGLMTKSPIPDSAEL